MAQQGKLDSQPQFVRLGERNAPWVAWLERRSDPNVSAFKNNKSLHIFYTEYRKLFAAIIGIPLCTSITELQTNKDVFKGMELHAFQKFSDDYLDFKQGRDALGPVIIPEFSSTKVPEWSMAPPGIGEFTERASADLGKYLVSLTSLATSKNKADSEKFTEIATRIKGTALAFYDRFDVNRPSKKRKDAGVPAFASKYRNAEKTSEGIPQELNYTLLHQDHFTAPRPQLPPGRAYYTAPLQQQQPLYTQSGFPQQCTTANSVSGGAYYRVPPQPHPLYPQGGFPQQYATADGVSGGAYYTVPPQSHPLYPQGGFPQQYATADNVSGGAYYTVPPQPPPLYPQGGFPQQYATADNVSGGSTDVPPLQPFSPGFSPPPVTWLHNASTLGSNAQGTKDEQQQQDESILTPLSPPSWSWSPTPKAAPRQPSSPKQPGSKSPRADPSSRPSSPLAKAASTPDNFSQEMYSYVNQPASDDTSTYTMPEALAQSLTSPKTAPSTRTPPTSAQQSPPGNKLPSTSAPPTKSASPRPLSINTSTRTQSPKATSAQGPGSPKNGFDPTLFEFVFSDQPGFPDDNPFSKPYWL